MVRLVIAIATFSFAAAQTTTLRVRYNPISRIFDEVNETSVYDAVGIYVSPTPENKLEGWFDMTVNSNSYMPENSEEYLVKMKAAGFVEGTNFIFSKILCANKNKQQAHYNFRCANHIFNNFYNN